MRTCTRTDNRRSTGILPVSSRAILALRFPHENHGQDARGTHGQDAHATVFRHVRRHGRLILALCGCLIAPGWAAPGWANEPAVDTETVHQNVRELLRASIAAPRETPATEELDRTAAEIQAMTPLPRPDANALSAAQADTQPATLPADIAVETATTQPVAAAPPALDANTIERLKLAPLSGPAGTIALADGLFAQNQLDGACALYTQALAQDKSGGDKDWVLFQIGNCLRSKDAAAARTFYKRVAAECPASPWAGVAASQTQFLDWQQQPTTRPAASKTAPTRPAGAALSAATPPVESHGR